jgi:hypothetical protein
MDGRAGRYRRPEERFSRRILVILRFGVAEASTPRGSGRKKAMVEMGGFEPPTPCLQSRCSAS